MRGLVDLEDQPRDARQLHLGVELEPAAGLEPLGAGRVRLVQTARFRPAGLLGLAYWYAVLPLHRSVFSGMLAGIRRAAAGPAVE